MRRLAPFVLVLWLGSGCFVFDELDKGSAILDQHAPKERRAKEAAAAAPAAEQDGQEEAGLFAGLRQGAVDWWQKATTPAEPERDPDDGVVSCDIAGRLQFLRKSDCQVRGGRVL